MATPSNVPNAIIERESSGIRGLIARIRNHSQQYRIKIFQRLFRIGPTTRLLDLGGWDGSHVNALINGTVIARQNVFIADIDQPAIEAAHRNFGITPVLMNEKEHRLDYPDGYFDIVFCSSVIEHVTVPKDEVWDISAGFGKPGGIRSRDSKARHAVLRAGTIPTLSDRNPFVVAVAI